MSQFLQLPTLYSRTNTGATQSWVIEVLDGSYRTHHGQVGGSIQTTEWTICQPKNEGKANATSGADQALKEAWALHKKKKKSGCYENIADIDQVKFIEPMLAKKHDDYAAKYVYPVYSSTKLDGTRLVAQACGLFSRNGTRYVSVPHISDALQATFEKYPELILDGEVYCDKFANDFNAICSLVKKTKPTPEDLRASAESIQYWIYDCVDTEKKFTDRYKIIKQIVEEVNSPHIKLVESTEVHIPHHLNELYEQYLEQGYEGQMIRINEKYENKRSKYLLKRKEFQDAEFPIIGYVEGLGNKSGMMGALVCQSPNGVFNSNIKGTREYLTELWHTRDELIGQLATVQYFNLTPITENGGGLPRFPYIKALRNYE